MSGLRVDELFAEDVSFIDTFSTYKPGIENAQLALEELRRSRVYKPEIITTTLNGTKTLTISDTTFHVANGTQTGYSYVLPDATTLSGGREYEIYNDSTQAILIKNGAGATLFTLNVEDIARLILSDNTSVAGSWVQDIKTGTASGITSYSIGSDTLFSTSSATDVLITGMTVTPVSGRYACYYSADIKIVANNSLAQVVFFKAGTMVTSTRRTSQGVGSNFLTSQAMLAEISVNGSETIDVRVNISSSSLDINQRRMILIRLGGV